MADTIGLRRQMVERQLAARGIGDSALLQAFIDVPREAFVSSTLAEFTYDDTPLPISEEQTISQPYIVVRMVDALQLTPSDDLGGGRFRKDS